MKAQATLGAYFLAKVITEGCSKASAETGVVIRAWDSLSLDETKTLALGIQYLLDLRIIEPISLNGVGTLRRHGWDSAKGSRQ